MATTLRLVEARDRDMIRGWRNHPDVSRFMHTDHQIEPEEHARWFEQIISSETVRYWVIEFEGRAVGLANIADIDRLHQRCSWGFYLADPTVRGHGIGGVVEYFVLRHVFEVLGLQKLCGEVLDFNQAVLDMHRSFGFVQEGRLRRHVRKGDTFHDVILISMLREEWRVKRPSIEERLRSKGALPPPRGEGEGA